MFKIQKVYKGMEWNVSLPPLFFLYVKLCLLTFFQIYWEEYIYIYIYI